MAVFETNPNLVRDVTKMAVDSVKRDLQPALDDLFEKMKGRPVEAVKPALKAMWEGRNEGASLTDQHLTEYATAISEGKRIDLV